jgi:NADP-dependent 3-hydroxy acid dehydrogenase YdfG
VTDPSSVTEFAGALERVDVLVINGGGAFDAKPVADADLDSWARTYDLNVLGRMVRTDEFSPNRLGSADAAEAVYRGVREPLVAEDVADCIAWAVTRPHHVNIDLMVVRPHARAAQHKVAREQ